MAAFNFPNSPNTNDTHTENGVTWKWNGSVWKRVESVGAQGAQGVQGSTGAQGFQGAAGSTSSNAGTVTVRTDNGNAYHQLVFVDSTTDNQNQILKMDDEYSRLMWNPNNETLVIYRAQPYQIKTWSGSYGTSGQVLTSGGSGAAWTWQDLSSSTTINNNANNRIITGSGTANTLEGEADLTFDASTGKLEIRNDGGELINVTTHNSDHDSEANRGRITLRRSLNNNLGHHTAVTSGTLLGSYAWAGSVVTNNWVMAAEIRAEASGTIGSSNIPADIVFRTRKTSNTDLFDRFRIKETGAWSLGSSSTNYGTSGQVLKSAGANDPPTWGNVSTGSDHETFASSGTWTKPTSGTYVIIVAWGGGGGGSYRFAGSAGGGGGACAIYITPLSSLTESSYTVTVGTGGAGATSNNSSGASGGNTSFGSILTAHGGQGACWNCGNMNERGGKGGGFGGVGADYTGGIPGTYANLGGQNYHVWSTPAGPGVFGGGGGGGVGGHSVYGGGGGASYGYSPGTSMMGGNGGAGGTSGSDGSVPGGGGGGGYEGSAGDGGAGRVDVYVVG